MSRSRRTRIDANSFDWVDRHHVLLRLTCAVLAGLLFATRPLWFGGSRFPAVPFFAGLSAAPSVELAMSFIAFGCLAVVCVFANRTHIRAAMVLFGVGLLIALVLLNQHRLQPWLLHLGVVACVLATGRRMHSALHWLTAGIYFHSAVSKLDHGFLTTHGFYLVDGLASAVGLNTATWSLGTRVVCTTSLPVFELLIAVLLVTRFRQFGWAAAIVMHAGLIAALVQLNHQPGVMIWNGWFVLQAVLLGFQPLRPGSNSAPSAVGIRRLVAVALLLVCGLPFLSYEPIGVWDNWPSWSLYSSRSERVGIFVHEGAKDQLPESVRQFVGEPAPFQQLCRVKVDRWSLADTSAPVYPEDRFQIAAALHLSQYLNWDAAIFVQIESVADRFTGKRKTTDIAGKQALKLFADRFWLNAAAQPVPEVATADRPQRCAWPIRLNLEFDQPTSGFKIV